jgi:glutathione S-transferase
VTPSLYHVALPDEWREARERGEYRTSTRGATLEEVGFIHLAYRKQVAGVIGRYFADLDEVIVLEIDAERLPDEVRDEAADPGGELFPHLYGPLPTGAVVGERRLTGPYE